MHENAALIAAARRVGVEFFHIEIAQFAYFDGPWKRQTGVFVGAPTI
jgi:hypothetical protein